MKKLIAIFGALAVAAMPVMAADDNAADEEKECAEKAESKTFDVGMTGVT